MTVLNSVNAVQTT